MVTLPLADPFHSLNLTAANQLSPHSPRGELVIAAAAAAVHDHRLEAMTALWLVPLIPGTTAAAVTGNLAKTHLHHAQSVLLLYLGESIEYQRYEKSGIVLGEGGLRSLMC